MKYKWFVDFIKTTYFKSLYEIKTKIVEIQAINKIYFCIDSRDFCLSYLNIKDFCSKISLFARFNFGSAANPNKKIANPSKKKISANPNKKVANPNKKLAS
jgi:hypothetical protein